MDSNRTYTWWWVMNRKKPFMLLKVMMVELVYYATDKKMAVWKWKKFIATYLRRRWKLLKIDTMYRICDNTWNVRFVETDKPKWYLLP